AQVQISEAEQDSILRSHLIDPALLRSDDFNGLMAKRKSALLEVISAAMGKAIVPVGGDAPADDE
ncbi:MAG: hypothetical protein HC788_11995, partial [Sphingopyxis sp.]|nr:hypothetical protein [Sphingopyxis sp.]